MDYQSILNAISTQVESLSGQGKQADYIAPLAAVNPDYFGICLQTIDGDMFSCGDADVKFSIQSISKVFMLACSLSLVGDELWKRIGREPSGTAFNSLIQLEVEHGRPRNPFINAGSIVMADILLNCLDNPEDDFIRFIRTIAADPTIDYNREVARAERSTGYLNAAIVNLLKYHGNIHGDIERVLEFYLLCCSIEMSCKQLSQAFLAFSNHRRAFDYDGVRLTASQVKRINAIMLTCGFYDEAGEFAYFAGLPGKSGVGGGISAVCPGRYSVTVWSPRLNSKGNSVKGMKALELLTTLTSESIF